MDIRKLQRAIVDGLEDVKAQHIAVFNTEALSPLFERVIIATGTSNRQTKALAASVRDAVKATGAPVPRTEGEDNGEWIIVDCGAAVVHIMQAAVREYYRLEELWGGKSVHLKRPGAAVPAAGKAAPSKAASAKGSAGGGARKGAKGATAGAAGAATAAGKTAARKSPAPRKAPARAGSASSSTAKKAPVRRAGAGPGPGTRTATAGAAKRPAAPRKTRG